MVPITISHLSLRDAVSTANRLGIRLGTDGRILFPKFDLEIFPEFIKHMGDRYSNNADEAIAHLAPSRIDREITISAAQFAVWNAINARYSEQWQNSSSDMERRRIRHNWKQERAEFRLNIVAPIAQEDVAEATLVYGDRPLYNAEVRRSPDGSKFVGQALIHLSHALSPEELWLREQRCEVQQIYRYFVPLVDDVERARQQEPRRALTHLQWRHLLVERAANQRPLHPPNR